MRRVFSLIVDNSSGVLSRVAGLFSRRGSNIDSLTVGETADPRLSRMTVVSIGDEDTLDQIVKQLRKLEDVRDIKVLEEGKSVFREIIMIKVKANASQRQDLEALSNLLSDYEVLELARTGLTALSRGSEDVVVLN